MNTNYTKLADLFAIAKAEADAAAKRVEELRKQILEAGSEVVHGDVYDVSVSSYETSSLIRAEVEKRLTTQQLERCTKKSSATRLTVKVAVAQAA